MDQTRKEPKLPTIEQGQKIKFSEIPDLQEYFSADEMEAMRAEQEYMTNGPGKIEAILNAEMERLQQYMEEKIAQQDEEFL